MWFVMERVQNSVTLSERLIRAILRSNSVVPSLSFADGVYSNDTIQQLIADGADVNWPSGNVLPLQCACLVGDFFSVKILLRNGAKANMVDGYKRAPLHYAAEKCNRCVELLLKYGALVGRCDAEGRSPLHWAASQNKAVCAQLLLEAGANPNAVDNRLDTPLNVAASKGNFEVARVLLDYNCNVECRNADGRSPLCLAAQTAVESLSTPLQGQRSCLCLMLAAGGTVRSLPSELLSRSQVLPNNRLEKPEDNALSLLKFYKSSPRTLKQLCRYAIRRNLKSGYVPLLVDDHLNLPFTLKRYVTLKECAL